MRIVSGLQPRPYIYVADLEREIAAAATFRDLP